MAGSNKLANYIEMAFFPLSTVIVSLLFIAFYTDEMLLQNISMLLSCAVVFATSHMIVRRKVKEENKKYFISSVFIAVVFFLFVKFVGVSNEIFFSGVTLLLIAISTYAIRPRWKISAHMICFMAMVTILSYLNIYFSALYALIPIIAWSRLALKRHDIYQVIAGTVLGLAIPISLSYFLPI